MIRSLKKKQEKKTPHTWEEKATAIVNCDNENNLKNLDIQIIFRNCSATCSRTTMSRNADRPVNWIVFAVLSFSALWISCTAVHAMPSGKTYYFCFISWSGFQLFCDVSCRNYVSECAVTFHGRIYTLSRLFTKYVDCSPHSSYF